MNKTVILDKDELYRLYIIENKSLQVCSDLLNTTVAIVRRNLRDYNIKKSQTLIHLGGRKTLDALPADEKAKRSKAQSERSKQTRNNIKNDPVKLEQFTLKQSESHKKFWSEISDERLDEISKTLSNAQLNRTPEQKAEKLAKEIATKRKNKSFTKSQPEDNYYQYLIEKYGKENVIRQYTDSRYKNDDTGKLLLCDFYIPSEDLFIECNYHWTHGGKPFDANDDACITKLSEWQKHTGKYWDRAIYVWTYLDPKKREIAKKSKLNFIEVY